MVLSNFQVPVRCFPSQASDKPNEENRQVELMRPRKRRLLIRFVIGLGLVGTYVYFNLQNGAYYTNRMQGSVVPCQNSESEVNQLLEITYKVHKILDDMKIHHWLMYGSIWGVHRIGKPLPWDNDVDIGFDGEGRFADMTLSEFLTPFMAAGLKVSNKWMLKGAIVIHKEGLRLTLDLFAFYHYGSTMTRRGIETWYFALNYRIYSFPAGGTRTTSSEIWIFQYLHS